MNTKLIKNLSDTDKKALKQEIEYSLFIPILYSILKEELENSMEDMSKIDNYSSPNFNLVMVDALATQRTLRKILDLLPKKEETK